MAPPLRLLLALRSLPRRPHPSSPLLRSIPLTTNYNNSPPRHRYYSTPPSSSSSPPPKSYTFPTLSSLSARPSPHRLIIDVREPSELAQTGRIPGALSMPISSNPDAFYLGEEEFRERFGWERPRARNRGVEGKGMEMGKSPFSGEMKSREAESGLGGEGVDSGDVNEKAGVEGGGEGDGDGEGEGVDEVIFYCKAGVRSRAAAQMAKEWKEVKVGQYEEGWLGWEGKGGKVER